MRASRANSRRFLAACAALLALIALSVLIVVPHTWHKEDGKRSCVVCQAYRTATGVAARPVAVEPPQTGHTGAFIPAAPTEPRALLACFESRAPPFPHLACAA